MVRWRHRRRRTQHYRPFRRRLLFDVLCVAAVIVIGVGVLWGAILIRPEFKQASVPMAPPPATLPVHVAPAERGGWVAWAPHQPECRAEGRSEKEARANLGQALQLGMRPECRNPAGSTPPSTDQPPPPGWYPDPVGELGEEGERWWDGYGWTDRVKPSE